MFHPVGFTVWRRVNDEERKQIQAGDMPEEKYRFNEDLKDYQVPKEQINGSV